MKRKAYVFGPMTGRVNYNYEAFAQAKRELEAVGYEVQTPFDCNARVWERHFGRPFNPGVDKCDYGDPLLCEMFAEDIAAVCWADVLVALPEWHLSRGGRIEAQVGLLFNKRFLFADTKEEFTPEFDLKVLGAWKL